MLEAEWGWRNNTIMEVGALAPPQSKPGSCLASWLLSGQREVETGLCIRFLSYLPFYIILNPEVPKHRSLLPRKNYESPLVSLLSVASVKNLTNNPTRILQNKGNVFSTLLRSYPPLKLDFLTANSLSFSLQLRNWSSEVFSSLFWATEHANRKTKIHVPQTFGVLFRNFLRTV